LRWSDHLCCSSALHCCVALNICISSLRTLSACVFVYYQVVDTSCTLPGDGVVLWAKSMLVPLHHSLWGGALVQQVPGVACVSNMGAGPAMACNAAAPSSVWWCSTHWIGIQVSATECAC
jgi:hypothetical protein